jgi:hypothetical protein
MIISFLATLFRDLMDFMIWYFLLENLNVAMSQSLEIYVRRRSWS